MKKPIQSSCVAAESLSLCAASIKFGGQKFTPDTFTAYLEVELSHALPVRTFTGEAIHPVVLANSYQSLLHKPVSINHLIKSYDRESIPRDRIIGSVVAVEIPDEPAAGWKIKKSREDAPGIRAIIAVGKALEGVDVIIGQHTSGRKRRTVSMEVTYYLEDAWLAWQPGEATPEVKGATDLGSGWMGIAYAAAPDDLKASWSTEERRMVAKWNGIDVSVLMGGADGSVQYAGIGIVERGNEKEAEIVQLLAAHPESPAVDLTTPDAGANLAALSGIAASFKKIEELVNNFIDV